MKFKVDENLPAELLDDLRVAGKSSASSSCCFSGSFTTSAITCSINFDIGMKKSPSA
jgi:hypothetical protein